MIRKIIKIGDSIGVTLDKKMLQSVGLKAGSEVVIEPASTKLQRGEPDKKGRRIVIRKRDENDW